MQKVYRSAFGKPVDMDRLRLTNEEVIAVGNMRVNARGDELGPGGEVVRTRNQVMEDYYKVDPPPVNHVERQPVDADAFLRDQQAQDAARPQQMRGNLADSVLRRQQKQLEDPEGLE